MQHGELGRWVRRLAAAAATAALLPAAAGAVSYTELLVLGGDVELGDFGDSFAGRTVLPLDADEVFGNSQLEDLCPPDGCYAAEQDFFAFTGLAPGTAFSITLETLSSDIGTIFRVLDDAQIQMFLGLVPNPDYYGDPDAILVFDGIVPTSGELVVRVGAGDDSSTYRVALDAQLLPEPATALLLGAGLAALGAGRVRARRTR